MNKRRMASAVFCAAAVSAQDKKEAPKPPEDVDKALRSRIEFFYQAHVDGKFRLADQAVAEESKDDFFAAPKKRYEKCEIGQITYGADFKTARAVTLCKTEMVVHGTPFPIMAPIPSDWKQQDGQWFWVFKRADTVDSPFGQMKVRDPKAEGVPGGTPAPLPRIDPDALARDILRQVRADKSVIVLDPSAPGSGEVKIANGMPGPIHISVSGSSEVEGLSATIAKAEVPAGGVGVISIQFKPGKVAPSGMAHYLVTVQQTGQTLPVEVKFAAH